MPAAAKPYHHGDLRATLIATAIELLAEKDVRSFSLAEASRHAGVSQGAPYKHFADRDELLAAVATVACETLVVRLQETTATTGPAANRLADTAQTYLRFALEQTALFRALFESGLDKSRYPGLRQAAEPLERYFIDPALELLPGDPDGAATLAHGVLAIAHGFAELALNGPLDPDNATPGRLIATTRTATLALIAGWPGAMG
jgi:AcrR family transcriptional regulator